MFCKFSHCGDAFLLPEFVEDGQPCFIGQTSGTCYQGKCYVKKSFFQFCLLNLLSHKTIKLWCQ